MLILTFLRIQSRQPRGQLSSCTMGFALSAPCGDDVPLAASPGNMFERFLCRDGRERPGTLLWLVEPGHLRISRKKNGYYCTQSSIRKAFNNKLGRSSHLFQMFSKVTNSSMLTGLTGFQLSFHHQVSVLDNSGEEYPRVQTSVNSQRAGRQFQTERLMKNPCGKIGLVVPVVPHKAVAEVSRIGNV